MQISLARYIPSVITSAEHKRLLLGVRGPLSFVVELSRVPDDLQHDLGDLHGVGGWAVAADARAGEESGAGLGVCDVRLVIWAVEVDTVPAAGVLLVMKRIEMLKGAYVG